MEKVGVFVTSPAELPELYNSVRLTAIQQHLGLSGPEQASKQRAVGLSAFWKTPKFITALPVGFVIENDGAMRGLISSFENWGGGIPEEAIPFMGGLIDTFLLDSGSNGSPGGTGKIFDWKRATPLVESMRNKVKVVVAGGLNPENVEEAIRTLHPWGVDVASGTEAKAGKKDPQKVRAFVEAVRQADLTA